MQSEALPYNLREIRKPIVARWKCGSKATVSDPASFVPRIAKAAGLVGRYRYWRGGSGRSYLFTRVEAGALPDFPDALVLLVRNGTIAFLGEAAGVADREAVANTARGSDIACYVHLLADTAGKRQAIIDDLAACAGAWVDAACDSADENVTRLRPAA